MDTLVIGAGQAGLALSYYLTQAGREHLILEKERMFKAWRDVYLSTGCSGRAPRRYRGHDAMVWKARMGFFDRTVEQLPSPADRFSSSLHVSGKGGGRTLNLHRFSQDGIQLLGHLRDGRGTQLDIAPDLKENLAAADKFAREFKRAVDEFIQKQGFQASEDDEPELDHGYEASVITELDLDSAGISSIIWATGYSFDFSWVKFPTFDEFGYPVQQRGVTSQPGLYFLGLHWLHTIKSGLLAGVGNDAAHVAEHIDSRG